MARTPAPSLLPARLAAALAHVGPWLTWKRQAATERAQLAAEQRRRRPLPPVIAGGQGRQAPAGAALIAAVLPVAGAAVVLAVALCAPGCTH